MSELDELIALRDKLESELGSVERKIHEKRCDELGIHKGEWVVSTARRTKGNLYQVSAVKTEGYSKWVYGRRMLKDGGLAKVPTCLFDDWMKVDEPQP